MTDLQRDNWNIWGYAPPLGFLLLLALLAITRSNQSLFFEVNRLSASTGASIWAHLTILGDGLLSALLIFPFIRKKPELIWSFVITTIVYFFILHFFKEILDVARPPAVLDADEFFLIGPRHKHHAFPSGHATTAMAIAATLILHLRNHKYQAAILALGCIIALSRVVVGVHWPADVLAGGLLGWSAAILGYRIARRSRWGYSKTAQYIYIAAFLIAGAMAIWSHETKYEQTQLFQYFLSIGCLVFGIIESIRLRFRENRGDCK